MPVAGSRPAAEAIVVAAGAGDPGPAPGMVVRYVGEDLVLVEDGARITVSIPASPGPDVVFVMTD